MLRFFTIAAYAASGLWILAFAVMMYFVRQIDAQSGRWIVSNATISVFGLAILLTLKKRGGKDLP